MRCTCSVRVSYLLQNCLVFGPYRPETKKCVLNENFKFKFKIDLYRHGPRPLLNDRHPAEPPPFSLYTTFKAEMAVMLLLVSWPPFSGAWLSYPFLYVLADPCPGCPTLAVVHQLFYLVCPAWAVLPKLSCPLSCPAGAFLTGLS
jgi:hypothetical protein